MIGFTRGIARELGEHRIRVNVITPGWIMTERQISKWLDAKGEEEIRRNQVLPDKVRPEDVAPLALFLASDDARAMFGAGIHRRRRLACESARCDFCNTSITY